MLMIVLDIFCDLFSITRSGSWEISEVVMPLSCHFWFCLCTDQERHVRVSLIADHLPRKANAACSAMANISSFIMCMMLTYWSWLRFWESFLIREESLPRSAFPGGSESCDANSFGTLGRYLMNFISGLRKKHSQAIKEVRER